MKSYYMPINLNNFNLFSKRVDDVETFVFKEGMEIGDYLFLYVTEKGLEELKKEKCEEYDLLSTKKGGFYGMARVISLPYESANVDDYLKGGKVVDAKITCLSREKIVAECENSPIGVQYTKPQKIRVNCLFN